MTTETKETSFSVEIEINDFPIVFDVTVWYEQIGNEVIVIGSEDDACLDNPPHWWGEKINQEIENHFEGLTVKFK